MKKDYLILTVVAIIVAYFFYGYLGQMLTNLSQHVAAMLR